jgi:hypothetical protein
VKCVRIGWYINRQVRKEIIMIGKFSRPGVLKHAYLRIDEECVSKMSTRIRENDNGLQEIHCEYVNFYELFFSLGRFTLTFTFILSLMYIRTRNIKLREMLPIQQPGLATQ